MGKILSHIPGFRTGTPRHMILAGAYYVFSLSMMLVSVPLGILLLSGPFLLFNGHTAIERYTESNRARALIALFVSAAVCGGSLIGFVMDMAGRQGDTPAKIAASTDTMPYIIPVDPTSPLPETASSPSPAPMERAIVLGYIQDGITMQFADESAGQIRLAGIVIDASMYTQAVDYMGKTLPPGSIVYLERDTDGVGYYVWMEDPLSLGSYEVRQNTLNALLVAYGYAAAEGNPEGIYTDVLTACQEEARADCAGLWAAALETAAAATPAPAPVPISTPIPAPSPTQEIEEAPAPVPEDPPAEPPAGGVYFCGSKNSDVFHLSTCGSASQISPQNLVIYRSREDAINQGKRPCKKCKP